MFLGILAGATRNLTLNEPAQEVNPHKAKVLIGSYLVWKPLQAKLVFLHSNFELVFEETLVFIISSVYLNNFHPPGSRCRDGERSGENEVFSGREGNSSPGSSPRPSSTSSSKEPLKVMPAPPPKENAWAKRSAASTGSNEGDARHPVSPVSPSGSGPPKFR